MPEGVPIQMLDEVADEMGVDANPPAGMLVHVHYEKGGQVHIMDVWESQDAYDKFNEERLTAATRKVAEAHGMDTSQGPGPTTGTITEVHRLVRGSWTRDH